MLATIDQVYERLADIDQQTGIRSADLVSLHDDDHLRWINTHVGELVEQARQPQQIPSVLRRLFINVAMHARYLSPFDDEAFAEMLMKKHEMYGSAPLTKYGAMGLMIKLDTKCERLNKIWSLPDGSDLNGESFADTLNDMVGYCVLGLIFMRYWK